MTLVEVQIDRLVGPTHHFGGLGVGNLASQHHGGQVSNPRAAALQGLDKMKRVAELGIPQVILPPQFRPDFDFLRRVGFDGEAQAILEQALHEDRVLLGAASSSSAMWVANAATVSAGVDNRFQVTTLTVANLNASTHRSIEPEQTFEDLRRVMPANCKLFREVAGGAAMRDEGAANHMRLGSEHDTPGVHLFVYGDDHPAPQRFWPRQTRAACEAIARQHGLDRSRTFFLKQHPQAIDAGAFHNDVVAASHHGLLIHHELAFYQADATLQAIAKSYADLYQRPLRRLVVSCEQLSLVDAVSTYLFNSQIVSAAGKEQRPIILCPVQVQEHAGARALVESWCQREGLFQPAEFFDLSQSMSGGGGPACLRLRVPLASEEFDQIHQTALWSERLDRRLRGIIGDHYPTAWTLDQLAEVSTLDSIRQAELALREALGLA